MKITVKLRFNTHASKIEHFGGDKYLVHLVSDRKDEDAFDELKALLSRSLGVPAGKIEYAGKNTHGDAVFEVN